MRFRCATCGDWHEGPIDLGFEAPYYWYTVPEHERNTRAELTDDWCSIDGTDFFVRGVLLVPIVNTDEWFGFGLWMSVSETNHRRYIETFDSNDQSRLGAFVGWMSSQITGYPDMLRLKVRAELQDGRQRPHLILEPTGHPLAIEQREGITSKRVGEILSPYMHPGDAG